MKRASGILMHISSLPGKFGIGTFGQEAYRFVDFLKASQQTYWQILPLTTTSYGDSPYQSFSAVAGNTNFIDFDLLIEAGWLSQDAYQGVSFANQEESVDYAHLFKVRRPILEKAVETFLEESSNQALLAEFEAQNASWLQDYAEFMAIKEHFDHRALQEWGDQEALLRHEATLAIYRQQLATVITYHKVVQYFFFHQWQELKAYANQAGIAIIGDMPIYVAADSVEVWTQPRLFKLDSAKRPLYVAGCPADDFSADGQLWGNPIYDWDYHRQTKFAWWVYRIKESFKLYDYLRIDHFKGFSDYWQIAADSESAAIGSWQPGPGYDLFKTVKEQLGDMPIIAEDLGYIDDKARALLADCGYPGMKVLEFGFYDISGHSIDIAHRCVPNSVAYIGTHDNEVVNGWYDNLSNEQQTFVDDYTNRRPGQPINETMLKLLFSTTSQTVIASMQDVLDKGAESRMNLPSTVGGNWQWRMRWEDLSPEKIDFLTAITVLYERGRDEDD
ncbi:4-alpha-glucanotransferase [Streptococcus cuniculipharyngis]|uniref:4-alpha-glucanotransferase n=1 Tax=Streptococcus cuniculipharyngis TaxID=1562651 RepID=A0A5C5SFQ7_9STRE|nr:4-alpha-glucanotransferase [Streptococcus cuniculipharyngis]TWS98973.1 4-alpha-glucanotransferase [Streptococcus cuniculipharyngis]